MPATARPMSAASEKRLLTALEQVADLTASGTSPNDAIVKAASTHAVPAGHIRHMVAAYNVGRTTAQRKSSEDPWEKAASFPLADTATVLEALYPEKSAAEPVSTDYDQSPQRWLEKLAIEEKRVGPLYDPDHEEEVAKSDAQKSHLPHVQEGMHVCPKCKKRYYTPEKAKSCCGEEGHRLRGKQASAQGKPLSEQRQLAKHQWQVEDARRAADTARMKTAHAFDLANTTTEKLAHVLRSPDCQPFTAIRANCQRLYGERVAPLFRYLEETNPPLSKQAAQAKLYAAMGLPYELVADCLEARDAYQQLHAHWEEKEAEAKDADQAYRDFIGDKPPMPPVQRHPIFGTVIAPVKEAGIGAALSAATQELAKGQAAQYTGSVLPQPKPDKALGAEMQRIKHRTVMQDLLTQGATAGHDPHQVTSAFQQIADVAPLSATKPAIARDFVGRTLAGGQLSYFDLGALVKIEKDLAQTQNGRFDRDA